MKLTDGPDKVPVKPPKKVIKKDERLDRMGERLDDEAAAATIGTAEGKKNAVKKDGDASKDGKTTSAEDKKDETNDGSGGK